MLLVFAIVWWSGVYQRPRSAHGTPPGYADGRNAHDRASEPSAEPSAEPPVPKPDRDLTEVGTVLSIEVVVTDDANLPLPRGEVSATGANSTPMHASCDDHGRALVQVMTHGYVEVTATAPGHEAATKLIGDAGGVVHLAFALRPHVELRGEVLTDEGTPLGGATIVVEQKTATHVKIRDLRVTLRGQFVFLEAVRGLPYLLRPGPGLTGQPVEIVAPATGVTIVWAVASGVRIRAPERRGARWWIFSRGKRLVVGGVLTDSSALVVPLAPGPYTLAVSDEPANSRHEFAFAVSETVVDVDVPTPGPEDESAVIQFVNLGDAMAAAQALHTGGAFGERLEIPPHSEREVRVRAGPYSIISAAYPGAPVRSEIQAPRGDCARFVIPQPFGAGAILRFEISLEGEDFPTASVQLTCKDDQYYWLAIYSAGSARIGNMRNAVPVSSASFEVAVERSGTFEYVINIEGFEPVSGVASAGARVTCAPRSR